MSAKASSFSRSFLKPITGCLLVGGLILLNGCMTFSDRGFAPVRAELSRQLPELELNKEFAISIGSAMFHSLDLIAIGSDIDFSDFDKVRVAVYNISFERTVETTGIERSLAAIDPSLTWDTVVNVRERNERTWVLVGYNEDRRDVEKVSVMVLEQDELVLIHVDGDMEEIIQFAFEPVRGRRGAPQLI